MKKVIPLRQQITKVVVANPEAIGLDNLVSGCFCDHINQNRLQECNVCAIRFLCYTSFKVKRSDI